MYLESTPPLKLFYEKNGFEALPETIVHKAEVLGTNEDVEVPLMVRMPARAGGMSFQEWRAKGYPSWRGAK